MSLVIILYRHVRAWLVYPNRLIIVIFGLDPDIQATPLLSCSGLTRTSRLNKEAYLFDLDLRIKSEGDGKMLALGRENDSG